MLVPVIYRFFLVLYSLESRNPSSIMRLIRSYLLQCEGKQEKIYYYLVLGRQLSVIATGDYLSAWNLSVWSKLISQLGNNAVGSIFHIHKRSNDWLNCRFLISKNCRRSFQVFTQSGPPRSNLMMWRFYFLWCWCSQPLILFLLSHIKCIREKRFEFGA